MPFLYHTQKFIEPLNLDRIFAPILKSKKEFELEGFFYTPLYDAETITYRQEVMQELENDELRILFDNFSKIIYNLDRYMVSIRASLISDSSYDNNYLTRGRMLDYADRYCREISSLVEYLKGVTLRSEGLCAFAEYLICNHFCTSLAIRTNLPVLLTFRVTL